jgi:hypothetical protein
MGFTLVISVFMILFGLIPVLRILGGAVEGGYEAFLAGIEQGAWAWIFLLLCFPIGLYGAWKSNSALDRRGKKRPPNTNIPSW